MFSRSRVHSKMKYIAFVFLLVLFGCHSYRTVDALYKTHPECKKPVDDALDKYCPHLSDPSKKRTKQCTEESIKATNKCYEGLGLPVPWAHEFPPGMYYIDPRCEKVRAVDSELYKDCGEGEKCASQKEIADAINKCYADLGMPEKQVGALKDKIAR